MRRYLFTIAGALLVVSGYAQKAAKRDNCSIVAISATSSVGWSKGYGAIITLENIGTHEIFESKSFFNFSRHSIIRNIPPGRYIVRKIFFRAGDMNYENWSTDVIDFFGVIDIQPNSKYYLGNFTGKTTFARLVNFRITNAIFTIRIQDQSIPEKLIKKIEKTDWKDGEFIKLYPYEKEELRVY